MLTLALEVGDQEIIAIATSRATPVKFRWPCKGLKFLGPVHLASALIYISRDLDSCQPIRSLQNKSGDRI